MTSSTFLDVTIFKAISNALLRTSMSGLDKTRRISMTRSSRTPSCSLCSSLTLSRTISLTLLSDSLMANSINLDADAGNQPRYHENRTFDRGRIIRQAGEGNSSFINNSIRRRLQQFKNQTKVFWLQINKGVSCWRRLLYYLD